VESLNKAAQAIRRDLVSSLLRPGGLDGGEKNWSLGWSPVGMGSVWIAGALGHNLSAWYSTGFRWFDSPDISGRMGGIAFVVRGDFYLVVTPIGLILRMSGHDPLQLKKPSENSVWKTPVGKTDATRYLRQS